MTQCQSILGQAEQFLSSEISQRCQTAQTFGPGLQAGYYKGIAFVPGGYIMVILGLVITGRREETAVQTESQDSTRSSNGGAIFCQLCGKKRPVSGDYCSSVREFHTSCVTMKRCVICNSLTGDDSLFWASCGHQEFRPEVTRE